MSEYIKQAEDFLAKHNATMSIVYREQVRNPWGSSTGVHDAYDVVISRNGKSFTVDFKQSAYASNHGIEPTAYDVLACLEKYGWDSYREFCEECGYPGSEESLALYHAVQEEYNNVVMLFEDCMEELREIC